MTVLRKNFKVERFAQWKYLVFNLLRVYQASNLSIYIAIEAYISKTSPFDICKNRQRQEMEIIPDKTRTHSINNWLIEHLWTWFFLQIACIANHASAKVGNLTISSLVTANKCLAELKALSPKITSLSLKEIANISHLTFLEESQRKSSWGQIDYIPGIIFPVDISARIIWSIGKAF